MSTLLLSAYCKLVQGYAVGLRHVDTLDGMDHAPHLSHAANRRSSADCPNPEGSSATPRPLVQLRVFEPRVLRHCASRTHVIPVTPVAAHVSSPRTARRDVNEGRCSAPDRWSLLDLPTAVRVGAVARPGGRAHACRDRRWPAGPFSGLPAHGGTAGAT